MDADLLPLGDPQTPFEGQLVAFLTKELPVEEFIPAMLGEPLVILMPADQAKTVAESGEGIQPGTTLNLFQVGSDDRPFLALFTSAERAEWVLEQAPEMNGALGIETYHLLSQLGDGPGIVINPGYDRQFALDSEQVKGLMEAVTVHGEEHTHDENCDHG
jgi:hypothetical protein